jgi:hypothetical protein
MNRPDAFESMGPSYPYILYKYLLSTWIKKKDKLLFYKRIFLRNLNNCTYIPSEVENSSIKHGEGLVETEYSFRNNYCSVRASDKVWWVMALSHVQALEKDGRVFGSPRFRRVRVVTLSTQGRLLCKCGYIHRAGKPYCRCYHVTGVIECTDCEIIWWDSFHYHFGNNIEYKNGSAYHQQQETLNPLCTQHQKVTKPVYNNCVD